MRRHRHLLLACSVVTLLGCAVRERPQDAQTAGPNQAYLDSVLTTFVTAIKAKDPTSFLGFYADNAVSYAPAMQPLVGKAAIAENSRQWFASVDADSIAAGRDGLLSSGDLAVETGWYYFRGKMFGQAAADSGRYLNVWQRQADGTWKIVRDMTNSSGPVPGTPPAGSAKQ